MKTYIHILNFAYSSYTQLYIHTCLYININALLYVINIKHILHIEYKTYMCIKCKLQIQESSWCSFENWRAYGVSPV